MNRLPCFAMGLFLVGTLAAATWLSTGASSAAARDAAEISFPLALQWKFSSVDVGGELPARDIPTAPIVSGDVVYVCARSLTEQKVPATAVYALSLDTGEKLWDHVLEGTVYGSPVVADDTLWVADTKGYLYALDVREEGRERSRFKLGTTSRSTPVIHDGVVYIGDDGGMVLAVDAKTLQERWRFQANGAVKAAVAISPEHNYVYVCSREPRLHVLNMADGKEVWNHRMPETSMGAAPLVWGQWLYIVSGKRLMCMSASHGRDKWDSGPMRTTTEYLIIGTPALVPDEKGNGARLYFCCEDGTVNALDAVTGRPVWRNPAKLDRVPTCTPLATRNALLVGAQNGLLYAISLDGRKLLWKYRIAPPADITARTDAISVASTPVTADGKVLALADEGTLVCFASDSVDNSPPEVREVTVRDLPIEEQTPVYGMPPLPFSAKVSDEGSGLDESKLVVKLDGEVVPHEFTARTGEVYYRTRVTNPVRPLADGAHTFSITAADWKGNTATHEWVFRVDHRRLPTAPKPETGQPGMGMVPGM